MKLTGILIDTIDNMVLKKQIDLPMLKDYLNFAYCKNPKIAMSIQTLKVKRTEFRIAIIHNDNALYDNMNECASTFKNSVALTYGTVFITGYDGGGIKSLGSSMIDYLLNNYIGVKLGKKCLIIKEEKKKRC